MKNITILSIFFLTFITACAVGGYKYSVVTSDSDIVKAIASAEVINSASQLEWLKVKRAIKRNDPLKSFDYSKNSLLVVYAGGNTCKGCGFELLNISEGDRIIAEV